MIFNEITEIFTQMFTTTDNLFSVDYTWKYMVLVWVSAFVVERVYKYLYKLLKNKLPEKALYSIIFEFLIGLIIFIGILYYGLVLLKIMWSSA